MTLLPRCIGPARHAWAGIVVAGALLLAGCAGSTVQKDASGGQAALGPDSVFPPGVLPDGDPWGPGYLGPVRPPTPATPYVALLLPLTGSHAPVGKALLNAAQLAVFEIAGSEFVLIVRDTRGTPAGAREAAKSALQAGASLILGPLFATSVGPVAEEARARGVNVVAFSNDVSVAGNGVFVMGLAPRSQVERVIDFAASQGLQRYAVLAPDTAYGHTVIAAMQQAVDENAKQLTRIASYDPAVEDPSPQVRSLAQYDERHQELLRQRAQLEGREDEASKLALKRLEALDTIGSPDFEAVMLPVGGKTLLTLAPLLAFYDIDPAEVRFLGTALWDDARLGSEVTLEGGWFAAPPPDTWQEFSERYVQTYGGDPVRIASLAYDATALAAVLSRTAAAEGRNPDFGAAAVTQPSGFAGVDGIFRFMIDGRIERGLAVLEMSREGLRVLDPSPVSFQELIN